MLLNSAPLFVPETHTSVFFDPEDPESVDTQAISGLQNDKSA